MLVPTDKDNPKTFMDAQLAYAKSKQGKEQKRKDKQGSRYYQIMQAAKRAQAQDKEGEQWAQQPTAMKKPAARRA